MCSSFKEISLRSVSLPLFVCEEGVAFWGMEEDMGASECHRSHESLDSVYGRHDLSRSERALSVASQAYFLAIVCIVMRISKWHFPLVN